MDFAMNILCFIALITFSEARMVVPSFHWNQRNLLFQQNSFSRRPCTDPAHLYVEPKTELYFVCPHVAIDVASSREDHLSRFNLYENIHLVSKEGYENCTVDKPNSLLLHCDKSEQINELKYEMVIFSIATWNGWQFLPNQTYYFIDTSDGTRQGLKNKSGGRCKTHNMKLKVTVCHPDQKCGRCKNMCCEKPAAPTPPSTTTIITTTPKKAATTLAKSTVTSLSNKTNNLKPALMSTSIPERLTVTLSQFDKKENHQDSNQRTKSADVTTKNPSSIRRSSSQVKGTAEGFTRDRLLFTGCGLIIGIVLTVLCYFLKARYNRSQLHHREKESLAKECDV